jgi:flagellar FliJ protein
LAKFHFELEAVLKQRIAAERQKQLALGEVERTRLTLEARLREFQHSITEEKNDLRAALSPGSSLNAQSVRMQAGMSLHFAAMARQTVFQLAALHRRLETARRSLLEATTRRKAVEKLRERRYEAWRAGELAKEARALDEIGVMGFAARQEIAE